jgi:phosphoribosyl-AMP cyclohydrolase
MEKDDQYIAIALAVRLEVEYSEPKSREECHRFRSFNCQPEPIVPQSQANIPDFSKGDGLLPAIAQDADTGEVLMLAWMNAESYAQTVATGQAVYFSRSRGRLWRKGEESGHVQQVEEIYVDCDADTILLKVRQTGPACHEGYRSCFFRRQTPQGYEVVAQRLVDPAKVYRSGS